MRVQFARGALLLALAAPGAVFPSTESDIAELKASLAALKSQYERRIQDLESRLAAAERRAATPEDRGQTPQQRSASATPVQSQPMTAVPSPGPASLPASSPGVLGALTSGNAFNPQISLILDGNYYQDGIDGEGATLVGEALMPGRLSHVHAEEEESGHHHASTQNGFNFREAELAFSATVDPYFDAAAYIALDGDGTVDLEEAWFQTRSLPYGLKVKAGKMLSDFGYINRQHPHQWDFVDQNLPYLNLLGDHGLQDTGVQVTWLPELPVYALFGAEAFQGDQEVFGATLGEDEQSTLGLSDTENGPRLFTAFAKLSPDLGDRHALQIGVSYAHNSQLQQLSSTEHEHEHEHAQDEDEGEEGHAHQLLRSGLEGSADLWGIDLVYKYAGDGPHGRGDVKLQAEYLRSISETEVRSADVVDESTGEVVDTHPELIGSDRTGTTDGLYAQAVYGFAPKWTAGLRYDVLGLTNELSGAVDESFGSSDRWTLDLTWNLSEFSRLRAQYARNDILVALGERERFDAFYLQFVMSLGAHGAHGF